MLNKRLIKQLFKALNKELKAREVIGEIGICGGAVMCLVFNAREATKDIDGIFEPTREIRDAVAAVAPKFNLPSDWLNDAAKGYFHADPPREDVLNLSNLRVWSPRADYMLAMKCVSARFDGHDRDDIVFLLKFLEIKKPENVFPIIEKYYPRGVIPPKTKFLIEELLP